MPDDIGNEPRDDHADVHVHWHLEHPGDAVRVQHIATPVSLLIEEQGWLVGWTGHGQLGLITERINCATPAEITGITKLPPVRLGGDASGQFPRLPGMILPGEDTPKPLPGLLEALFMLAVEPDQGSKDKGERGLEWTVVGKSSRGNDEEVEEKTGYRETDGNVSDNFVDGEQVVGEGITEEEESELKHEG